MELTEKYLTDEAEKQAKIYASKDNRYNIKLDKGQLRKFYDEFKIIERRIDSKQGANDEWFKKEILPLIKFVKSKIAYNAGRKVRYKLLVCKEYKEYMYKQIDEIKSIKDFNNFLMHYQ